MSAVFTVLTAWLVVAAIIATVLIGAMLFLRHVSPRTAVRFTLRDPGRALLIGIGWPVIVFTALASLLADGLHFASQVVRKPH